MRNVELCSTRAHIHVPELKHCVADVLTRVSHIPWRFDFVVVVVATAATAVNAATAASTNLRCHRRGSISVPIRIVFPFSTFFFLVLHRALLAFKRFSLHDSNIYLLGRRCAIDFVYMCTIFG